MNCKDKKHCSKCGVEKPLGEFRKDSSKKDGRRSDCKDCTKADYQANRERILGQQREYQQANKDRISEYKREYRQANRERILEQKREYRQANKEYYREYQKARYASDPIFALAHRCRTRIGHALKSKGFSKDCTTAEMLGCTYEELMRYIESQFVDGMSWENRSEWHIDHIVPLASAETEEELWALCQYTNLQPLWAEDNHRKSARLDWAA